MEKKLDRRVQRTRKLLKEAMLDLVLDKGYDATTILDITDHANLGRATFYVHYRDKEELLTSMMEEVFEDLVRRVSETIASTNEPLPMFYIFHHASKHADLYRALFQSQGCYSIVWKIQVYLAEQIEALTNIISPEVQYSIPKEIWTNYIAGSILNLLYWWLKSDMPYPPEYMEHAVYQLGIPGIFRVMGDDMNLLDNLIGSPLTPEAHSNL